MEKVDVKEMAISSLTKGKGHVTNKIIYENGFVFNILKCCKRVADRFLGMKNDVCNLKRNNFIFAKLISAKLILVVFELLCKWKTNCFH